MVCLAFEDESVRFELEELARFECEEALDSVAIGAGDADLGPTSYWSGEVDRGTSGPGASLPDPLSPFSAEGQSDVVFFGAIDVTIRKKVVWFMERP